MTGPKKNGSDKARPTRSSGKRQKRPGENTPAGDSTRRDGSEDDKPWDEVVETSPYDHVNAEHEELIRRSAIPPDLANVRMYRSVDNRKGDLRRLGFAERARRPGLLMPLWWQGRVVGHQLRIDSPSYKQPRYESPVGQTNKLDCHPSTQAGLADDSRPLLITEGVRKADAAIAVGYVAIALTGVDNWRGTRADGTKGPVEAWDDVPLAGRTVLVAYDSDAESKEGVRGARDRLTTFLRSKGASVRWLMIPPGEKGAKVGLDDFLANGGDLGALVREAVDPDQYAIEAELRAQRIRDRARELLKAEKALQLYREPPDEGDLAAQLLAIHEPPAMLIPNLHPKGANTTVTGRYKTGKTTLLGNLARSLADGEPFLGLPVEALSGNIAFFNLEMDKQAFLAWLSAMNIRKAQKVVPLHLRGYRLPLTNDVVAERVVKFLRRYEAEAWIIDPWRRMVSSAEVEENSNSEVNRILDHIDDIKREAGVFDCFVSVHTGRKQHDEGTEHGRGATALDDWADVRWIYSSGGQDRFLRADGRDVHFPESRLRFDPTTKLLSVAGGSRSEEREAQRLVHAMEAVTAYVAERPGTNTRVLTDAIEGDKTKRSRWIRETEAKGYIRCERRGREKVYSVTEKGRKFLAGKVTLK